MINSIKNYIAPHLEELARPIDDLYQAGQFFEPFQNIVVLGTGGSSLGGQALCSLTQNPTKKIVFLNNIDPVSFQAQITQLDFDQTGILAISKSGNTTETLMQIESLKVLWPNFESHAQVITDPASSKLRHWAQKNNVTCFDHPPLGGRYSGLSIVGLLPAHLSGLDIQSIRSSARIVFENALKHKNEESTAYLAAQQHYDLWSNHNIHTHIMWIYIDALAPLGAWWAQLWAESVGKRTKNNKPVGTTPVVARGTVDQHSQLQLYLDGPRDKFFTVITTKHQSQPLPHMATLMNQHQSAAIDTLRANNLSMRQLHINTITPQTVGELMAYFMLETWWFCEFAGINPLDQPAVEQIKIRVQQFQTQS